MEVVETKPHKPPRRKIAQKAREMPKVNVEGVRQYYHKCSVQCLLSCVQWEWTSEQGKGLDHACRVFLRTFCFSSPFGPVGVGQ